MDIKKERDVFLSKQPKEIARIFSLIEFCESLNIFRFKKSNTKLDLGVDLHILNYGWSMWQAAKDQAVPEGFILVPKEPTSEVLKAISAEIIKPNNGRIFLAKVYKAMIEAQQPSSTSDCPDEP